ncbi:MAG: DUF1932 domain-containing protein [Bacillota bacterium]
MGNEGEERVPEAVALLGFGEAGSSVAAGLRLAPAQPAPRIVAFDPAVRDGARARFLRARAQELAVGLHDSPGPWLGEAGLVFSAVPGTQALAVAQAAKPFIRPGTVYVDLNTAPPGAKREAAALVEAAGGAFVDGAVLGSFQADSFRVPILLAGHDAERVSRWLLAYGFRVRVMPGGRPGDASAIKLLRSVFMKGLEALCIECLTAAERAGLRTQVLEALGDLDSRPIGATIATLVTSHLRHAPRRLEEVEIVERMLRQDGFEPILTEATRRFFDRTVRSGPLWSDPQGPDLDEALGRLLPVTRAAPVRQG